MVGSATKQFYQDAIVFAPVWGILILALMSLWVLFIPSYGEILKLYMSPYFWGIWALVFSPGYLIAQYISWRRGEKGTLSERRRGYYAEADEMFRRLDDE
jgi:hypothetical protein